MLDSGKKAKMERATSYSPTELKCMGFLKKIEQTDMGNSLVKKGRLYTKGFGKMTNLMEKESISLRMVTSTMAIMMMATIME